MKKHLAIFDKITAQRILNGQKTVETRFSKAKIAPFAQIGIGDTVFIKPSGQDIIGQFKVAKVIFYQGLDQTDWQYIKATYGQKLSLGTNQENEKYFNSHSNAIYGSIIFITRVEQFITSPIKFTKKDLRGWVVLEN